MRDSARRKKVLKVGATQQSPPRYNERGVTGVICVLLVAIVWIVFGQTFRHEFVGFDDADYVYENLRIRNGLTPEGIGWAFTHVHAANWHPLTTISHMLDCQFYGLQPWGHHVTNVLLHSAAAVFLFFALWQLTDARWPSAFVAAVFAIHPQRIESVAWVAERKDVLSGAFFMLTLWAYARYVRCGRPSSGRYALIIIFFALGLMCKPTLVTLPFVLLLLDYWPLRRFAWQLPRDEPCAIKDRLVGRCGENPSRGGPIPTSSIQHLLVEKIPLFALSAAACAATLLAQGATALPIRTLTFGDRIGNVMTSYVAYLGQMIWPAGLAVLYPFPVDGINVAQAIFASLVLLIVSIALFIWRSRYAFLWIGWLWFLGVLVPMIGIVHVGVQARADRYTYLAQIGLYLAITWGAVELLAKWRRGREVLILLAVLIITALTANSYFQTSFWRNGETLWNRALANTSSNHFVQYYLGNALMHTGKLDEAIVHFQKALEIYPDYSSAINDLGYTLMKKGELDDAVIYFRKALAVDPNNAEASNNLGYALARKGNWAEAIAFYRAAIRIRPNYPIAHNNLAVSLAATGKTDEAIEEFGEALRLDGGNQDGHFNLASLLLRVGRRDEAIAHLREVLRLKPDDAQVTAQLRQLGVEK